MRSTRQGPGYADRGRSDIREVNILDLAVGSVGVDDAARPDDAAGTSAPAAVGADSELVVGFGIGNGDVECSQLGAYVDGVELAHATDGGFANRMAPEDRVVGHR